uniref:Retrovirus-related Pol polyprotein from transposon TNT 1-94-like beta-barrel domain-containing protein n=1 Tax=Cannabis sativa TaxID=3483 RepID=A0A803Q8I9_CANSA
MGDSKAFPTEIEEHDNPQAYSSNTVPEFLDDYDWYADTGAANHVAQGMEQLDSQMAYSGPDALTVGNGKKLAISHVGNTSLPSSSLPLKLQSVLKVPHITKNLVSVLQLTKDNHVFLEFHSTCCFVKNKVTGTVLLKGRVKNDLYTLSHRSFVTPEVNIHCHLATSAHRPSIASALSSRSEKESDCNNNIAATSAITPCNDFSINKESNFSCFNLPVQAFTLQNSNVHPSHNSSMPTATFTTPILPTNSIYTSAEVQNTPNSGVPQEPAAVIGVPATSVTHNMNPPVAPSTLPTVPPSHQPPPEINASNCIPSMP